MNGEPDPSLSFGIENLECPIKPRLEADLYIEAFGSRITRPRNAKYGLMIEDLQLLVSWLSQYLGRVTEVHKPFYTMEPAFALKFSPVSGDATEVSARLQAYGTVDMYFVEETGPAIIFETTNQTIATFRQQLIEETILLVK
ncbi:MAG: hypothetical protein AUG17_02030 [Crenarchaeota archaeon 13_1_20CM_2_53_14]|nr:MAG: hypothetical protein AUI07_01780 [archaeon 13_2_20CM_2_53_6]OLE59554.1 MAG: hypothetical protein AUG17_02030 [Crenarchaeota archaeon 13_1_20CM_2_53_14]